MVLRPGEAPLDEPRKKVSNHSKENNRTYAIIMNDKPRHQFHLRYVVYTLGIFFGCKALYNRNDTFRNCCDGILASYQRGMLMSDFKSFIYNSWLSIAEYGRQLLEKFGLGDMLRLTN